MHVPVLKKEVLEYLNLAPNKNFIDATIGEGGHTISILERIKPNGRVLGIELDKDLYQGLLNKKIERLIVVNDSFVNIKKLVKKHKFKPVSGILFDLGFSSWHIEESKKGFSFMRNEVLDMRYNENLGNLTAAKILNELREEELIKILKEYGEERYAKRIAKAVVKVRKEKPIKTTFDLIEIIKKSVPKRYFHQKIHFATRTFQALRIAVNNELENIKKALPIALDVLEKGGRLVVISFHSLEDRIVKNFFKERSKEKLLKVLTKKPVRPTYEEIIRNRRSRSAKLRAAEKL